MRSLLTLGLVAVALGGCKRTNELYCDDSTPCAVGVCNTATNECEDQTEVDAAALDAAWCGGPADCTAPAEPICDPDLGACRGCADGPECAARDAAEPICAPDGRCVQCTGDAQCSEALEPICRDNSCQACATPTECADRDPAAPVCAPDGACVECYDHGDCPSTVCDRAARTCVDGAAVIYVDRTTGADSGGCGTSAEPCETIEVGLTRVEPGRTIVRIAAATYSESDLVIDGIDATLIGPGATLTPSNTDRAALAVTGGANVLVDGLTIRNATGNVSADGVHCSGAATSIALTRVAVSNNDATGVEALTGCAVAIEESTVRRNTLHGVAVDAAELRIERSLIAENRAGGIKLENTPFTIVNNFVVGNGSIASGGSIIGGVWISQDVAYSPQRFEFNTVVENLTGASAQASGVFCFAVATARNDIVYDGVGAPSIAGTCTWEYSDVEGAGLGGSNIDEPPQFVDVSMGDYHLTTTSPARDAGDPASTVTVDFDGDRRPLGDGFDLGADEVVE